MRRPIEARNAFLQIDDNDSGAGRIENEIAHVTFLMCCGRGSIRRLRAQDAGPAEVNAIFACAAGTADASVRTTGCDAGE
jgi:hypothetical protein